MKCDRCHKELIKCRYDGGITYKHDELDDMNCPPKPSQPTPVVVPDEEKSIFPPLGDKSLHFEDAEVLANVEDSEYAKSRIGHHLMHMTGNEKWSLYRAIVSLTAQPAPLPSYKLELILLNAYAEYQAQRDMWMGKECPSLAEGCSYRMKEIEDFMKPAALPSDQKETFEELKARVLELEDLIRFLHRQGEQDEDGDMRWKFCLSKHHRDMESALRDWQRNAAKGGTN